MKPRHILTIFIATLSVTAVAQDPKDPPKKKKKPAVDSMHVVELDSLRYVTKTDTLKQGSQKVFTDAELKALQEKLGAKKGPEQQQEQKIVQKVNVQQQEQQEIVLARGKGAGNVGGGSRSGGGNVGGGDISQSQFDGWLSAVPPLTNAKSNATGLYLDDGLLMDAIEEFESGFESSREILINNNEKHISYRVINTILEIGKTIKDAAFEYSGDNKNVRNEYFKFEVGMYEQAIVGIIKQLEKKDTYLNSPFYCPNLNPNYVFQSDAYQIRGSELDKLAFVGYVLNWYLDGTGVFDSQYRYNRNYTPRMDIQLFVPISKIVMKRIENEITISGYGTALQRVVQDIGNIIANIEKLEKSFESSSRSASGRITRIAEQVNDVKLYVEKFVGDVRTEVANNPKGLATDNKPVDNKPKK